MKTIFTIVLSVSVFCTNAQVGIGTTIPNSTLDVRGSLSLKYRSFASGTTALSTDNTLAFTGTSAATLTLPDATTCTGRSYSIKNLSTTIPTPILTIATASSQTIDGNASWLLETSKEIITVISDGTNWIIISTMGELASQPYGSVSSSVNQFVSSTTTLKLITYETNEVLNLITHSTTVNPSRIAIQVSGTYLITFSAELSGGSADVDIWLRQNGTDVPRSNSRSHLAGTDYRILTVTFIVGAVANDYFELVQSSTNTSVGLTAVVAGINPTRPAITSIIATINKISD
jgi:hypothetical protein